MPTIPSIQVRHALHDHVNAMWPGHDKSLLRVDEHPITDTVPSFRVACIHPQNDQEPWVYLSLGGFELDRDPTCGLEWMLLARESSSEHASTLALVASLHSQGPLRQGSVIDLHEKRIAGGELRHLLVTLPYPYGPQLERCQAGLFSVRILWLLPITEAEFDLLKQEGTEALESRFEQAGIDFLDPCRASVV